MQEDFLHYLWKHSLFNKELRLSDKRPVEVVAAGIHNHDSGPDFFNAKIKIGSTVWAGNVEMHVLASDWLRHQHQNDRAYDNVILHVVAKNDKEIYRENGEVLPVVELQFPDEVYKQYLYLLNSKSWVPCESFINKVNEFVVFDWKETLMIERLEQKSKLIEERYIANNKNWEETFYQTLAYNFGFKTNALPFEMLAKSLPLNCLAKHKDELTLIEAMLYGQSGLLPNDVSDAYTIQMQKDYLHLRNKFSLQPIKGHLWKYSRLRPANFPTIRMAQFASLIFNSNALMSKIIEAKSLQDLKQYFSLNVSDYWQNHYVFGKVSEKHTKNFGQSAFQNIVINTVAPFFAFYGKIQNNTFFIQKTIDWLMQLNAEDNHVTMHWKQLGMQVKNAFDSQALIQLKNIYCNRRQCLNCRIGNQVIQHKL